MKQPAVIIKLSERESYELHRLLLLIDRYVPYGELRGRRFVKFYERLSSDLAVQQSWASAEDVFEYTSPELEEG